MADNYIEKQYEQYEARKAAWEKARKHGLKKIHVTSKPDNKLKSKESESTNKADISPNE